MLATNGFNGQGVLAPRGKSDIYDGTTGWLNITKTGVAATEVDLITASAPTVAYSILFEAIGRGSSNTRKGEVGLFIEKPAAGSTDLGIFFDIGLGVSLLTVRLYSTGRLTVRRTGGTETWQVGFKISYQ